MLNTLLPFPSALQVHASIPRYRTPLRYLHSIHDTPHGNVLEHRLLNATYTIMSNALVYYTQLNQLFVCTKLIALNTLN
jgi:hypothetical protein